jgi:hypothetical protein
MSQINPIEYISILVFHLHLGSSKYSLSSGIFNQTPYEYLFVPVRSIYPVVFIPFDFIILRMFGVNYNVLRSQYAIASIPL